MLTVIGSVWKSTFIVHSFDPLRQNQSFEMIDFRLTDFSSLKFYSMCEQLFNIYFCKICEEVLFCWFL